MIARRPTDVRNFCDHCPGELCKFCVSRWVETCRAHHRRGARHWYLYNCMTCRRSTPLSAEHTQLINRSATCLLNIIRNIQ